MQPVQRGYALHTAQEHARIINNLSDWRAHGSAPPSLKLEQEPRVLSRNLSTLGDSPAGAEGQVLCRTCCCLRRKVIKYIVRMGI
jgi:hypothetical protein